MGSSIFRVKSSYTRHSCPSARRFFVKNPPTPVIHAHGLVEFHSDKRTPSLRLADAADVLDHSPPPPRIALTPAAYRKFLCYVVGRFGTRLLLASVFLGKHKKIGILLPLSTEMGAQGLVAIVVVLRV